MISKGPGKSKVFFGLKLKPPEGKHWKFNQEKIDQLIREGKIRLICKECK